VPPEARLPLQELGRDGVSRPALALCSVKAIANARFDGPNPTPRRHSSELIRQNTRPILAGQCKVTLT